MSDWEEDWEHEIDYEGCCPYGFEFCSDPQSRVLGLCTTECETYLESVESEEKEVRT